MSAHERPVEPALQEALKKLALGQWLTAAERECVLMEVARLQFELGRERYLREVVEAQLSTAVDVASQRFLSGDD